MPVRSLTRALSRVTVDGMTPLTADLRRRLAGAHPTTVLRERLAAARAAR